MLGLGLTLGSGRGGATTPSLRLSANTVAEDASIGTTIGTLSVINHASGGSGWTFAKTADPDSKFAVSGADLNTDAVLNYEAAASHSVTITASKSGQSDIVRTFTIAVTNVEEPPALLAEGDSITAVSSPASYSRLYAADQPAVPYTNIAVGGDGIANISARLSTVLASDATVVTLLVGANDLAGYSDMGVYLDTVFDYTDAVRAAGKVLLIATVLPRGGASAIENWETKRGAVNAGLRAAIGTHCDDVIDFDTCSMGLEASAEDTGLYSDGLHPTSAGHAILKRVYATTVNHWLGIANEPLDFAFAAQTNATVDTDYESTTYAVDGLYPGETRPYSATGYVSKNGGAYVLNGSGTAVEGDTFKLRVHSSTDEATETTASLTIGSTMATYSVTTEGGSVLWTPLDLGSKLAVWLTPETLTGPDGSDIEVWVDQSGNGNDFEGTGGGAGRPMVETDGLNGYPVVSLGGANQSYFIRDGGLAAGRSSSSTFFVVKNALDPNPTYLGAPVASWGSNGEDYWPFSNGGVYTGYGRASRIDNMNPTPSLADWHIIMLMSAPSDWRLTIDGTDVHTESSNTVSMQTGQVQLGVSPAIGSAYWEGLFGELIDTSEALTTLERQKVEGYLAWKYGLEANLPAGHPYEDAAPMT